MNELAAGDTQRVAAVERDKRVLPYFAAYAVAASVGYGDRALGRAAPDNVIFARHKAMAVIAAFISAVAVPRI